MAVLVHVNGSLVLRVETDLESFEKAYKTALAKDLVLKIVDVDGKTRVVNPRQISYFEDEDQTQETPQPRRPEVAA